MFLPQRPSPRSSSPSTGGAGAPRTRACLLAGLLLGLCAGRAAAQAGPFEGLDQSDQEIVTRADELSYDHENNLVIGRGHVVVRRGDTELRADSVRVDMSTEDVTAEGHVELRRASGVWRGDRLQFNMRTGGGGAEGLTSHFPPFFAVADSAQREAANEYVLHNAQVTTCTNAHHAWHYHVVSREVRVQPGESAEGRNASWWFGPVPAMWVPYWRLDLDESTGLSVVPGYSSRMGAYLLGSYRYRINPILSAETQLDYRTKRGVAVGQAFTWKEDGEYFGDFAAYYADDQEPIADDEDPAASDVDNQRYRVRFRHRQSFSDRDYALLKLHVLSDTDVLEDFFESEFRRERQPENYAVYTHRGDLYTFGLLFRGRLNDFYSNVNRLPEATLDVWRRPLGDSSFFYESRSSGAFLEQLFPDGSADEEYSAFRLDTEHKLLHAGKYFGWLNLVPRVGVRGTYYSDSVLSETREETVVATVTNANGTVTTETQTRTVTARSGAGSEFRTAGELGFEASYKAFRAWQSPRGARRHVAEPYLNYTFAPEPSATPDQLYQFDEVDELDEDHQVRIGMRNKLQAKRRGSSYDMLDVDVFTVVNIQTDPGQDTIESVFFDAETWPWEWLILNMDAIYGLDPSNLEVFNAEAHFRPRNEWSADVDFRYEDEDSTFLAGSLHWKPSPGWSFNMFGRHEFEEGRTEEVGGYLQRNLDCMSVRFGSSFLPGYTRADGSDRDAEYRVLVELWLTAFPHQRLTVSGR